MRNAQFDVASFRKGKLAVFLNDEAINQLLDVLESALDKGVELPPAIYAMGEKLTHKLDPDGWFGPDQKVA